jgi:DNA-binding transcriptional MocR family regulator
VTIPGLEIDLHSEVPVYRQIVDGVRAAALAGTLPSAHRLPATRDLARVLGVNRNTVVAAYETLAEEGWVTSRTGKGTFLVARPGMAPQPTPPDGAGEKGTWFNAFSLAAEGATQGGLQTIYSMVTEPAGGISFVGSYPAGELIPVEAFRRSLARTLDSHGPESLAYGPTAGHTPLRATIAASMRERGMPATAEDILITNGAQQALELVFRAFVDRGDAVAIEEPSYTGAFSILGALGARVIGIPADDEGLRPDLLAIALERHRPRLLYMQPTFQNPTTRVTSESRRRELLAITSRYRCPIVEDDWAGDLRFEGEDVPTLHALDGGQHVIYLSTFSKKLMPGLRLGWLSAPLPVLTRLVELKRLQDCGSSPLLQIALDDFLRDGGLERHLERVRPAYRARRDAMLAALERHFPDDARWQRPLGGLFVWVHLPAAVDGDELFVSAKQRGVLYSRGELFHSDGAGKSALRLTYSAASEEQIREGVAILGELMHERWPSGRAGARGRQAAETMPIF